MAVYMIRAGEHGPVKIGTAESPYDRLGNIQVGCWEKLSIIRLLEGSYVEEMSLHEKFADLHIRGEWHNFSRSMLGDVGLVDIELAPHKPLAIAQEQAMPPWIDFNRPEDTDYIKVLLCDIEAFLYVSGMRATTFGIESINDGKLVSRLRSGANVTRSTIDRARAYLAKISVANAA